MATYALTVSTNALGLGVISGATVVVERKRTTVTDIYPTSSLYTKKAATNVSGIATILLEADDGTVFHEVKIFDTAGILIYKNTIQMPPQAADIEDLPLNDIITESAQQAIQAKEDTEQLKQDVTQLKADTLTLKNAAQTSEANAANSENSASNSASSASTSATNSANSASAAATSETNATNAKNALEQMTQNKTSKIPCGVIRNTGTGWGYIIDSAHEPLFFTGTPTIVTAPEDFKLTLTHTTGMTKVGTLVCCPDETFAPYGVVIGASVGTDSSTLRAGMPLRFRTYGATAVADFHPFFGSRVSIAALGDGTGFTITTPQLQNGTATTMPVVSSTHYIDGRADDIQIKSLSLTQFEVRAVGDIDAYLFYNTGTSAWVFTTDTVANLTASWNTDTLTVTHDSSGKANLSAFLQQVYGGYRPVLVASNANSFSVKFVNDAGTVQTTLSSAFKFRLARPHKMPKLMLSTQTCYFDCGMALLYWGDIISANGNIWLQGLMHN